LASDANLEVMVGTGNAYAFGTTFRPRNWNGSIQYSVQAIPEPSTLAAFLVAGMFGLLRARRRRK
jgi:hypothetical protein